MYRDQNNYVKTHDKGAGFNSYSQSHLLQGSKNKVLGLGTFSLLFAGAFAAPSVFASATNVVSGTVKLNTEVSSAIAMKIVSPNDVDPNCTPEDGVTYGVANRYATSNGSEGSKVVDTFDGREGQKDEVNENTSCATLTMTPNTYASTYSDVSVYTNSPSGYALSVKAADGVSPNLVNIEDDTKFIPAGVLTETDDTEEDEDGNQVAVKTVPGGQNKWSIRGNLGVLDEWTAVTDTDQAVRSYERETSGGSTTRVTYGISAGSTPSGKYATTLTYTAASFDGENPAVPSAIVSTGDNLVADTDDLKIPYKETRDLTITPNEGYYISSVTCSSQYTCTDQDGNPIETGEDATSTQIISVTNSSKTQNGTITITTEARTFDLTVSGTNTAVSTDTLTVPYGGSRTLTVTPNTGYYLSSYSCPSGYICTKEDGSEIETNSDVTTAQTIKVTNNNSAIAGALSFGSSLKSYDVAITPSLNATTSTNLLSVPYGQSASFTITPNAGYYLTNVTCSEGYTCSTPTYGSASNPNATSRGTQTITVTNNSYANTGAVTFTLGNTYRISFSKSNVTNPAASYVDVAYGGSTSVTVTPTSGYYLSGFSGCPSGWSCTGVSTGTSYTGNQTLTITNNNSVNIGTLSFTGTVADPFAGCSTTVGSTCTVGGVTYKRLADNKLWTSSSRGSATWANAASLCPANTHLPSADEFDKLLTAYGGSYYSSYGSPYGWRDGDADLYNATGWSGNYWSSTEYNSSYAWYLSVTSSRSLVDSANNKSGSYNVVCLL